MNRTSTVPLAPTETEEQEVHGLADGSARLRNMADHERRRAYFAGGRVPSYETRWSLVKDTDTFKRIGTCKGQALLLKFSLGAASLRSNSDREANCHPASSASAALHERSQNSETKRRRNLCPKWWLPVCPLKDSPCLL
jgi:hypothetical protein